MRLEAPDAAAPASRASVDGLAAAVVEHVFRVALRMRTLAAGADPTVTGSLQDLADELDALVRLARRAALADQQGCAPAAPSAGAQRRQTEAAASPWTTLAAKSRSSP